MKNYFYSREVVIAMSLQLLEWTFLLLSQMVSGRQPKENVFSYHCGSVTDRSEILFSSDLPCVKVVCAITNTQRLVVHPNNICSFVTLNIYPAKISDIYFV